MRLRVIGLATVIAYATFIVWLYARQPRTVNELTGGVAAAIGAYRVDPTSFDEGLRYFRQDQFGEARRAFARADPAEQDAVTQFYIAYAFYREGWGRLSSDDVLFAEGLEAAKRAEALAPSGRVFVDDGNLGMRSSDELITELERGLRVEADDFNPLRITRPRK